MPFHLYDRNDPYFSSATPPSATSFVDDSAARTHYRTVTANDAGVGVNRIKLETSRGTPDGAFNTTYHYRGCSGVASGGCRGSWPKTLSYTLPEGVNTIKATAQDQVIRSSPAQQWIQPIDRSAPVVDPPSGTLYSGRADIRGDRSYSLRVSASDGSTASDAQRRSGIKRIEVFVDDDSDDPIHSAEYTDAQCNLRGGGCPATMATTWQVDPYELGEGSHTISMIATDRLGHQNPETARQFTVNVTTDIESGELTLTPTAPGPDGSYQIVANAIETQTLDRPVSGISYMDFWSTA